MEGSGKRAYPRFAIDADVELRLAGAVLRGRTRNISRGGLCVELPRPVERGATVEVAIKLVFDDAGESEPLVLAARTTWSTELDDGHQVGVQFGGLRPRDITYLEVFLRYLEDKRDGGDTIDDGAIEDDPFA
jgi:hypothetical protein